MIVVVPDRSKPAVAVARWFADDALVHISSGQAKARDLRAGDHILGWVGPIIVVATDETYITKLGSDTMSWSTVTGRVIGGPSIAAEFYVNPNKLVAYLRETSKTTTSPIEGSASCGHPSFSERCEKEATRNVVFIFQRKRLQFRHNPPGYEVENDGDSWYIVPEGESDHEHFDIELSYLIDKESAAGAPCVEVVYEDEGIWLSREEAEAYGEGHKYNYPQGWRVYGIPSNGKLAELIKNT
jgi:hypothetical protein